MSAPASNGSLHRFGPKAWAGAVRGGLWPFGRTLFGRTPSSGTPFGNTPLGNTPFDDNSPAGLAPDVPGVVFGGLRNTRFGRFLRRHPTAVDFGLVLLLAVMSEPGAFSAPQDRALHVALAGLVLLPLVWRRRFPVLVFLATCAVALVQFLFDVIGESDVAVLVAFYTVAATCRRRVTYAAAVVVAVGTVLASIRLAEQPEGKVVAGLVFLSALAVTAGVLGINVGTRRMHLMALADRAARLERERDQQAQLAAAAERARIAREMHDVVAHNLSVMIALADGAAFAVQRSPDQAASAIATVSATGREALAEMRRLLGVLRESDGSSARAPQPGLADVRSLVDQVRRAGLPVTLTTDGMPPAAFATGAQLTVYRLVQEALTNTLKHAGSGASAQVTLDFDDRGVEVSVLDDGRPDRSRPPAGAIVDPGPGQGINGMRARTAVYGGTVDAGPGRGGGWRVRARVNATATGAATANATGTTTATGAATSSGTVTTSDAP